MIGIYCIENLVNGKRYIGQSVDINRRIRDHKYILNKGRGRNKHIQGSWKKYGSENFIFSVLSICEESELDERERLYISLYKTNNELYGFNLESGGNSGKRASEKTKKLFSIINKRPCSDETKRKLSSILMGKNTWMTGKPMPEETKRKISESLKGRKQSRELVEKRAAALRGKKQKRTYVMTKEHVERIVESRKRNGNYVMSDEQKQKISDKNKGRIPTPEIKARRIEGIRKYWRNYWLEKENK